MSSGVSQLYKSVIDDVINSIREVFLDENLDEHVLQELKQCWENKLTQTKAVPPEGVHVEQERVMPTQFTIQTQQPLTTTAGSAQSVAKPTRAVQYKYGPTLQQQLPAGSIVQPVQYQYAQGDLGDVSKTVTITLPQTVGGQKPVTISLPAATLLQQGGGIVMSTPAAAAASALPPGIAAAAGLLQPSLATISAAGLITHQNSDGTTVQYQAVTSEQLAKQAYTINVSQAATQAPNQVQQVQLGNSSGIIQLDGAHDTSDEEEEEDDFKDDDNDIDNDDEQNDDENDGAVEDEEPLNSGDDVSDEDPTELFDTDNVIVCQYDKITRSRNKWKFHLKDGIMNLQGKDFVFQRASGDAEW